MKHTELPWSINPQASGLIVSLGEKQTIIRCSSITSSIESRKVNGEANAAFIVKACNSHYQLLGAIKDLHRAASFADYSKEIDDAIIKAVIAIKQAEAE